MRSSRAAADRCRAATAAEQHASDAAGSVLTAATGPLADTGIGLPLATCADGMVRRLARATGADAIAKLDGATLLYERAMLGGLRIPGRTSAGGGCRLFDAIGDTIALNLSRATDRELLPALFETDDLDPDDDEAIAARIARSDATHLLARARSMGLAIASVQETSGNSLRANANPPTGDVGALGTDIAPSEVACACVQPAAVAARPSRAGGASVTDEAEPMGCGIRLATSGPDATRVTAGPATGRAPRVLDLSALWAGPLAAHLLWLAGAEVVKVESRTRPDSMRAGGNPFYALLNQGKASVVLDFTDANDRRALLSLIATSDIVIEAARPRALAQLGIDAAQIVRTTPGLVWVTITGHGDLGDAANWVGFGDDCAVSGGFSAALREATGRIGFVGDAAADPLTGISAALVAWEAWMIRRSARFVLAMSGIAARCLATAREQDPAAFDVTLKAWSSAVGKPFPTVERRSIGALPPFGESGCPQPNPARKR